MDPQHGTAENGFYTQPLAQHSNGYLGQHHDEASLKAASDFPSPSASPRPSTSHLMDDQRPGSAQSGQQQQYYQLTDPQIRYAAVQHDMGASTPDGGPSRITSYAESSTTLASVEPRKAYAMQIQQHQGGATPVTGSALRNAYPMTSVAAQQQGGNGMQQQQQYQHQQQQQQQQQQMYGGAAGGRPQMQMRGNMPPQGQGMGGPRPNLPVIKGGISEKPSFQQRRPWFIRLFLLLVVCAIAGGVVAAIKIIQMNRNKRPNLAPTGGSIVTYFDLPKWNWTSPTSRAFGVNLGNWLVLERWLDEDAFVAMCGSAAFDEYHCTKTLGTDASVKALQTHQTNFIAESDIDAMQAVGVNMVRVTLGFWALIPTVSPEPYVNAGQMDQLKKLLGWLNTRKMRAIISLHGMPGSQSGDQSTGQFRNKDRGANWFTAQNQQRSIATVQALMDWIDALSPELASTIAAVLPVNEPNQMTNDDGTFAATLQDFYTQSYAILSKSSMVMAIHSGQGPNNRPAVWASWLADKDPSSILWEAHPYPGWFPSRSSKHAIYKRICDVVQLPEQLPARVPVFVGEWSVLSGVEEDGWVQSYWQTQLAAYSQSAGSTFWTWKSLNSSNPVVALTGDKMANYNFQGLVSSGVISKPPGQTMSTYLSSLPNNACSLAASTAPAAAGNGTAADASGSGSGSGSEVDEGNGNPTGAAASSRR
ncbi:hypothetical protein OC835_007645 [Tilletia horrida]|nr:hypothetical protein OC835_007645 [Tilletia horrida]